MTRWLLGVAAFAVLWTIQYALTLMQARHYLSVVRELRGLGSVGSALVKGRFGPGAVAVIAAGPDGRIVAAREMSGVSVFARFRPVSVLIGTDVAETAAGVVPLPGGVRGRALREAAGNLLKCAGQSGAC
ncbi:MAG: transcriptional regulator GutM [Ignavibacteriales bacterium]